MIQQCPPPSPRCPVCKVRFRGQATCSRCGTDLSALMRIAGTAWAARERAHESLRAGDLRSAVRWLGLARQLHNAETA